MSNPAKRKVSQTAADRKRAKTFDARTLAAQSSDAALSVSGELDAAAYVAAREFEIRALEKGIQQSKSALTSRAFQQVPRSLRRRTASHNVKRVPRRLRARAKREMIEDNTPTVTARRRKPATAQSRIRLETARRLQSLNAKTKRRREVYKAKNASQTRSLLNATGSHGYNTAPRTPKIKKNKLSRPQPPDAKYAKRQRCKTWLPTHVFHAKRAKMTTAGEPLWRFAVPLSPTEKSYRPSHRARGARGAIAWDMSYISTIQLEGSEVGLESVLRAMGVDGDEAWGSKGRKWRDGTRWLETWVFDLEGKRPIAPVAVIRAAETKGNVEMVDADAPGKIETKAKKKDRKKAFIRVHPSAFLQLWNELLAIAKRQNPPVIIEDLRFEIGSIEVTGPGATEALIAALRPSVTDGTGTDSPEATWASLLGVTNPSSLPQNALLAFSISDPRLHFPCQTLKAPSDEAHTQNQVTLLASWPPDKTQGTAQLFDRSARLAAARQLPSQKAINRRRTLAGPGNRPAQQDADPQIPIILLASRPNRPSTNNATTHNNSNNLPGSWTLLLPWKCVLPVWYSLMYYPLSSGGNPRFGGLQEQRQLAFEAGSPWFPGDFPGTRAGWEWGLREREQTRREWERKPKGRRVEFDSLDLGNGQGKGEVGRGWACDWERLMLGSPGGHESAAAGAAEQLLDENHPPGNIYQLRPESATTAIAAFFTQQQRENETFAYGQGALATVRIELVGRGTPTPRARIYRLPTSNNTGSSVNNSDGDLSRHWLEGPKRGQSRSRKKEKENIPVTMTPEAAGRSLLTGITTTTSGAVGPRGASNSDREEDLPIPGEEDLIGFVTTGAYNLAEGRGTGIGSIALSKVVGAGSAAGGNARQKQQNTACIVRGAGERVGRLGHWEVV